mmetsp:Transcript_1300/g.2830  ORF Transcript_1300/g.2830 Transcript_1300/m.2830 type:complete len:211 (-) Transcript_1300:292-924(-)
MADSTWLSAFLLNRALITSEATSSRLMEPHTLMSEVTTALPVAGSLVRPPGRMITKVILSAWDLSTASALSFSTSTGLSTSYTFSPAASLVSPQPMEVTRMNFFTPFFTAASIRLMLPWESTVGLATVPPMVETTASTSSMLSKTFCTSSLFRASPFATIAIIFSISERRTSVRCNCHTQLPMSFSLRVTCRATPPPPQTKMLALSGSRS